jgi:hypothetical protein
MEPIQIIKATNKCNSINFNKDNCNCKVESFIQDKSNTGYNIDLISNIRLIAWIVLIIIIIYLFKCLVI